MTAASIHPRTSARARAIALAIGLALAMLAALGSSRAEGSTYLSAQCAANFGITSHADAVFATNSTGYGPNDGCGGGGGLMISQIIPISVPSLASWTFTAPPEVKFKSVAFDYVLANDAPDGESASVVLAPPGGTWVGPSAGWQSAVVNPSNPPAFTTLQVAIQCGGICDASPLGIAGLKNLQFDISDLVPPRVDSVSGSLLAGAIRRGNEEVTIAASDNGGGIEAMSIKVNGAEVVRKTNSCSMVGNFASSFRPCPRQSTYAPTLNTEAAPWRDGQPNRIELCAHDLSRGEAPNTTCVERIVQIDNSCPASGLPQGASLDAGLEQSKSRELRPAIAVKSTEGATLRGSLSGAAGPVSAANVCVYERVDAPQESRQLVQQAKTKTDGKFAVLIPSGPSRALDVVYRYNNQLLEKQVYFDSSAVPTLKIQKRKLHNGQNMRFSGSIPGPHAESRGVTMQAKVGKRSWRTFKQLKTNRDGTFKGRYRFKSSTLPRAEYTFRVLVKKQGGYPYSPGASRKRKVVVFG